MTIQEDFICNLKKIDANSAVVQIVFVNSTLQLLRCLGS